MKFLKLNIIIPNLLSCILEKENSENLQKNANLETTRIQYYEEMLFNFNRIKISIENACNHPESYVYLHNYVNVFLKKYPNQQGFTYFLRKMIEKKGNNSKNYFYEE